MSLDTHVRFTREMSSNERARNPFTDSKGKPSSGAVHHFPYAILEIEQTSEITPTWVQVSRFTFCIPYLSDLLGITIVITI